MNTFAKETSLLTQHTSFQVPFSEGVVDAVRWHFEAGHTEVLCNEIFALAAWIKYLPSTQSLTFSQHVGKDVTIIILHVTPHAAFKMTNIATAIESVRVAVANWNQVLSWPWVWIDFNVITPEESGKEAHQLELHISPLDPLD